MYAKLVGNILSLSLMISSLNYQQCLVQDKFFIFRIDNFLQNKEKKTVWIRSLLPPQILAIVCVFVLILCPVEDDRRAGWSSGLDN